MQAPTIRIRLSFGAIRMVCSIMPGTPTASKTTSGFTPSIRRHAWIALSSFGSTTSSQPRCSASRRRAGEKSAPTIGPIPSIFIAAMQASPTGPSPITIAASPGAIADFATAWTPTDNGSVNAASSWGSPVGTLMASSSLSAMYSA